MPACRVVAQRACELRIRHRIRRGHIERTGNLRPLKGEQNSTHSIFQCDPTHPLTSIPDACAKANPKWRQHLPQRALSRTEHNTKTQMHNANARHPGSVGGTLPFATETCEKSVPIHRGLIQHFIASVSIKSDR